MRSAAARIPAISGGSCWYVDNTLPSNGNGLSWRSAWKSFAHIDWGSISPGDKIFISGGITGQTYNELFPIGASGSATGQITITAGTDPGHGGIVTIDAQGLRSECIAIKGQNYVTVQNLTVQNTRDNANLTVKGASAGVIIQNIISNSGMGVGNGTDCRCFDIRDCVAAAAGSYAIILQNCIGTTPRSTTSQTDTLWTSGNKGVLVQNNSFTVANTDPTGHSDCIQSYQDFSVTYRCNFLAHPNGGINNHGFILQDVQNGGTLYFYDNVIVMGSIPGSSVGKPEVAVFRYNVTPGYSGVAKIYNNTIIAGYVGYWTSSNGAPIPAGDEFKNNIIYCTASAATAYYFSSGDLPTPGNTDYNLVYVPSGKPIANVNGTQSWTAWKALGYDQHGINGDPLFVNEAAGNYQLQSTSLALHAGASLSVVGIDYTGATRPAGSLTIGAYTS